MAYLKGKTNSGQKCKSSFPQKIFAFAWLIPTIGLSNLLTYFIPVNNLEVDLLQKFIHEKILKPFAKN